MSRDRNERPLRKIAIECTCSNNSNVVTIAQEPNSWLETIELLKAEIGYVALDSFGVFDNQSLYRYDPIATSIAEPVYIKPDDKLSTEPGRWVRYAKISEVAELSDVDTQIVEPLTVNTKYVTPAALQHWVDSNPKMNFLDTELVVFTDSNKRLITVSNQVAINVLSNVESATDEFILTKDTATGNAIWKRNKDSDDAFRNSQHDDVDRTDYISIPANKDSAYILNSNVGTDILGIVKSTRLKGERVVLIPENGLILKHNSITQDVDSYPLWFIDKQDKSIGADVIPIEFILTELSAAVQTLLGVTSSYIWLALETGVTAEVVESEIFAEPKEFPSYDITSTAKIYGFTDGELLGLTLTVEGDSTISSSDNTTVDLTSGNAYNIDIKNALGETQFYFCLCENNANVTEIFCSKTGRVFQLVGAKTTSTHNDPSNVHLLGFQEVILDWYATIESVYVARLLDGNLIF